MRGSGEPPLGPTDAVSRDMPPTGLVPHPVIDPSRAQTMLTVLTQIPRFVSGNWVEATAAGLYPAILEGTLVTQSSRKIPPMKESAMNTWTVAAAKAKFSEVIELARSRGPQTITAAMWSRVKSVCPGPSRRTRSGPQAAPECPYRAVAHCAPADARNGSHYPIDDFPPIPHFSGAPPGTLPLAPARMAS
jgi:hypothetical protein